MSISGPGDCSRGTSNEHQRADLWLSSLSSFQLTPPGTPLGNDEIAKNDKHEWTERGSESDEDDKNDGHDENDGAGGLAGENGGALGKLAPAGRHARLQIWGNGRANEHQRVGR